MNEVLWRFPHIGEHIFKKLRNKDLVKCKNVSRSWYNFITNEKFHELRVHYENIQKIKNHDGETQLHQKARNGQISGFKLIIDHVENKNPTDKKGDTPLHWAAKNGHLHICKLICIFTCRHGKRSNLSADTFCQQSKFPQKLYL